MKGWTGSFVAARVAASLRVRYGFRSTFGRPLLRRPTRSLVSVGRQRGRCHPGLGKYRWWRSCACQIEPK
jgi:hypothetical protein